MTFLRRIFWIFGGLLVLAVVAWGIRSALRKHGPLQSDPSALRDDKEYRRLTGPASPFTATNLPPLSGVTQSSNGSEIQITFGTPAQQEAVLYDYTIERMSAGQKLRFGDGEIGLKYIGVAYGKIPANQWNSYSSKMPGHFYGTNMEELTSEKVQRLFRDEWERQLDFRQRFPEVRFLLGSDATGGSKIMDLKVIDARTKKVLTTGYSSSFSPGIGWRLEAEVQMWHTGPVELLVDLATGPVETFKIPLTMGGRLKHPRGETEIVGIVPGERSGWGISSGSGTNTVSLSAIALDPKKGGMVVLASRPQASPLPIDFELVDHQGKVLPGNGGGVSGQISILGTKEPLSEIEFLQARYYTKTVRMIISLPFIPGLPDQRKPADNLFDEKIPFVLFKQDYEMEQFLRSALQLEFVSNHARTVPPSFFPRAYENVTPKAILDDYLKCYAAPLSAKVDPVAQKLELQETLFKRLWLRVKKWFK